MKCKCGTAVMETEVEDEVYYGCPSCFAQRFGVKINIKRKAEG